MAHRHTQLHKPLRILEWNANGIRNEALEFAQLLTTYNIDIALIAETKITRQATWRIPNYDIYLTEGPIKNYGGTAVIVKSTISHCPLTIDGLDNVQLTAIEIFSQTRRITVGAVYIPPAKDLLNSDLDKMTRRSNDFIFGGDFNAKSPSWNSRTTNKKGRILLNHSLHQQYDVFGPTLPTIYPYAPNAAPDILDIFIIKPNPTINSIDVLNELSSDHNPVLLEISLHPHRCQIPTYKRRTTNWAQYRQILNDAIPASILIETKDELDLATETLQNTIRQAYHESTTETETNRLTDDIPDLADVLREKRRVRKRWQRHRQQIDKQYLNYITRRIHDMIADHKIRRIDQDLKTAVENNNYWNITKRFTGSRKRRNHPIHGVNGLAYEAEDKAKAIADTLDRNFRSRTDDTTYEHFHRTTRRRVRQFLATAPTFVVPLTSPSEIKKTLMKVSTSKSPGPDRITVEALRQLPRKSLTHLTKIFNTSLLLKHFPDPFKRAHIIAIPKPKKNPLFPQNYRPISILDHAGKVLERIILKRLQTHLLDTIPDTQFGFKPDHSATLQLLRITDDITAGYLNREHTTAVFFDIQRAYDSVWHMGLTQKLITANIPDSYIHLLHSFTTRRQFKVKHEGKLTDWFPMKAGVPQGSVLAPTLYNIYTADIPTTNYTKIAQYADDTTIYCTDKDIHNTTRKLQRHINKLTAWFSRWRITLNIDKTEAIVFTRRRPTNITQLTINNRQLEYRHKTKYLGITMDKQLTFKDHIKHTRAKALQRLAQLYPILKSNELTIKHKIHIYTAVVRSVVLYACPVWGHAAQTHLKSLQIIQNKAARIITGADRYTRITQLHDTLEIQRIEDIIIETAKRLKQQYTTHRNTIINNIGTSTTNTTLRYRTPHILTQ